MKTYQLALVLPGGRLEDVGVWSQNGKNVDVLKHVQQKWIEHLDLDVDKDKDENNAIDPVIEVYLHRDKIVLDLGRTITSWLRHTWRMAPFPTQFVTTAESYRARRGIVHRDVGEEDDPRGDPFLFWPFGPGLQVKRFMIGKTSGKRTRAFRTPVTGRFKRKYYKAGYTHICVLAMFDAHALGITGRKAEKLALDVESDLRDAFEDCVGFDKKLSDHGSGSVARVDPDHNWYGVYIALRMKRIDPRPE